jgi:hypothetical protein
MTKSLKLPDYNPYNEFERRINPILPNIDTNEFERRINPILPNIDTNEFERRINPILPNIDTNWNPPLIEGYVRLLSECKTFVIDLPKDCELITEFLVEGCTLDV